MYFVLTSDHKLSDEVFTVRRAVDIMFCQNSSSKLSINYQFTANGVVYVNWIAGVCLKTIVCYTNTLCSKVLKIFKVSSLFSNVKTNTLLRYRDLVLIKRALPSMNYPTLWVLNNDLTQ